MNAVVVHNLSKNYGKKNEIKAVKEISFEVSTGELFGVIGPDGAGKSTLFRMLTTLLLPDNGSASVDGSDIVKDFKAIRNKVGYMPGRFSLYQDLSVEENLNFFATIFNTTVKKNYDLIKDIYVQIEPFKKRKAGKLSGGMKQKLALSCALIHRPVVLFLDEPTTGVDAVSRKEFWEMLMKLKSQGITILVSTPYMDEAGLCDRIGLMQNGKLLSVGTPKEITASFSQTLLEVKSENMYALLQQLIAYDSIMEAYSFGEYHHAVMKENFSIEKLQQYLEEKGNKNVVIKNTVPTIEDCFMQLMKK
ncbi:MAG: ABC transporter ATP-binding protein [Bacteroidetes bacterium]|nr:ABC transporter ATP-binding protein [Bacteroidota bacterium]